MNKQNINKLLDIELPDERGVREMGERVKGLRSTNCLLHKTHGDVIYGIGSIVDRILITTYSVK